MEGGGGVFERKGHSKLVLFKAAQTSTLSDMRQASLDRVADLVDSGLQARDVADYVKLATDSVDSGLQGQTCRI